MRPFLGPGVVALGLLALSVQGCQSDRDRAMEAFAEAQQVRAGDPERAARLLEEAVRLHPPLHEGFGLLAEMRLEQEDWTAAEHAAQEAVRLTETAGYRETLGHALAGQGRLEHAIDAWQRALVLDEGRHHLHLATAEAYLELERPADAAVVYARVLTAREEGEAVDDAVFAEACLARVRLLLDDEEGDRGASLLGKCRDASGIERTHGDELAEQTRRVEEHEAAEAARAEAAAEARAEASRRLLEELGRMEGGILGALRADGDSAFGSALGDGMTDREVWGGLMGTEIGEAYGVGGLGLSGTGRGGGGTGEGTIGLGRIGTIDRGGAASVGSSGTRASDEDDGPHDIGPIESPEPEE